MTQSSGLNTASLLSTVKRQKRTCLKVTRRCSCLFLTCPQKTKRNMCLVPTMLAVDSGNSWRLRHWRMQALAFWKTAGSHCLLKLKCWINWKQTLLLNMCPVWFPSMQRLKKPKYQAPQLTEIRESRHHKLTCQQSCTVHVRFTVLKDPNPATCWWQRRGLGCYIWRNSGSNRLPQGRTMHCVGKITIGMERPQIRGEFSSCLVPTRVFLLQMKIKNLSGLNLNDQIESKTFDAEGKKWCGSFTSFVPDQVERLVGRLACFFVNTTQKYMIFSR